MTTPVDSLDASKSARLDLKTTEFAKEFIRKAAAISGLDMTSFIMSSAFEKAEAVMSSYNRLQLSSRAFERLHEVLRESETDATPTDELVRLMRLKNERTSARERKLRS